MTDAERLARDLGAAADPEPSGPALARVLATLAASARAAGARAVATGPWAAATLVDTAPRIPVRDLATLEHQHALSGAELAGELIRRATRASAVAGAAGGAVATAGELMPPAWVTIPFELVAQTLTVAFIELKLIAELHEVYGAGVRGTPGERANALVRAWADRRGVTAAAVARPGGLSNALGRGTRNELIRIARRRLAARFGRSMSSLAPLLIGAVAGAEVNRRGTRSLGEAVLADLAGSGAAPQRADRGAQVEG